MENRALHYATAETGLSAVGLCVFSPDKAVPTNLREKSISVKVDECRNHQLLKGRDRSAISCCVPAVSIKK